MKTDKSKINNILFITLSNIGDVVLTMWGLAELCEEFKHARVDILTGKEAGGLFKGDERVQEVILYDKHSSFGDKVRLIQRLRRRNYDIVVDLKGTAIPFLLGVGFRNFFFKKAPGCLVHMRDRHLWKVREVMKRWLKGISKISPNPSLRKRGVPFSLENGGFLERARRLPPLKKGDRGGFKELRAKRGNLLWITEEESRKVDRILKDEGIEQDVPYIVVAPGAKSHTKRWTKFGALIKRILEDFKIKIVLVGGEEDIGLADGIIGDGSQGVVNLCGRITIKESAEVVRRAAFLISNDSALLHIGCAVGTRVMAIFGPTDSSKYGPTGAEDVVVREEMECMPCEKALCRFKPESPLCMERLDVERIFEVAAGKIKKWNKDV